MELSFCIPKLLVVLTTFNMAGYCGKFAQPDLPEVVASAFATLKWPGQPLILTDDLHYSSPSGIREANSIMKSLSRQGLSANFFAIATASKRRGYDDSTSSFNFTLARRPTAFLSASVFPTATFDESKLFEADFAAVAQLKKWLSGRHLGLEAPVIFVARNVSRYAALLGQHVYIDQMVYFLHYPDMVFSETYAINGHVVVNDNLGRLVKLQRRFMETQWLYEEPKYPAFSLQSPITGRRSNFHGKLLRVMIEQQSPYTFIRPNFEKFATYIPENDTYLVPSDLEHGVFPSILDLLKKALNFTMVKYIRKDRQWGALKEAGQWTGIIRTMLDGGADLASASLTSNFDRSMVVDFLPPIGTETYSLYVRTSDTEELSWGTYANPFTFTLWTVVVATALGNAILMRVIHHAKLKAKIWEQMTLVTKSKTWVLQPNFNICPLVPRKMSFKNLEIFVAVSG